MLGARRRAERTLFVAGSLEDLVPEDHLLRAVDAAVDFSWVREVVAETYSASMGRPSIDPEAALRLMLGGYLLGVVHDRAVMRVAQVNVALRWFAGFALDERLPDHSSLTRIRQRWGVERFKAMFLRVVGACKKAGLIGGKVVHIDATLVRADAGLSTVAAEHAEGVVSSNGQGAAPGVGEEAAGGEPAPAGDDGGGAPGGEGGGDGGSDQGSQGCKRRRRGRPRTRKAKRPKVVRTDPESSLTKARRGARAEPAYKAHTAVDGRAGVIVDVAVTTGTACEGGELMSQLERVEAATGRRPDVVTADTKYGTASNYTVLEEREIHGVVRPPGGRRRDENLSSRRFRYDARHETVRCAAGRVLPYRSRVEGGWQYRSSVAQCRGCRHRGWCLGEGRTYRTVRILDGYAALLRAQRRWARGEEEDRALYRQHRHRAEGAHAEGKTRHGLRRAVRRGRDNVGVQAYLTAMAQNIKRLVRAACSGSLRGVSWALWSARGLWARGRAWVECCRPWPSLASSARQAA